MPTASSSLYLPSPYYALAVTQGLGGTAWPSGSPGHDASEHCGSQWQDRCGDQGKGLLIWGVRNR